MATLALLQVGVTAVAARQIGLRLIGTRWRLPRPGMQIAAETGVGLLLISYLIYGVANRRLGPGDRVYLVNMRTWGYLLDLPGRGEMQPFPNGWRSDYTFEHYRLERALVDAAGPGEVAAYFRDQGITHLMIDEQLTLSLDALAPCEGRLMVEFLRRYGSLLYRNPRDRGQPLWRLNIGEGPRP